MAEPFNVKFNTGETSTQNLTIGETSNQDATMATTAETSTQNLTIGEASNQDATMATTAETSTKNLTIDETSNQDPTEVYDFTFIMPSARVLRVALKALSDETFNPGQNAVIQVGEEGCEIIVSTLNVNTDISDFGYLSLKPYASGLKKFQCNNPIEKSMSLSGITSILDSSAKFRNRAVIVYSVQGSNELSLHWGYKKHSGSLISTIPLKDVDRTKEKFPDCITYALEVVIPSALLKDISKKLNQTQPMPPPDTVEVILQQLIRSGNGVTSSTEDQAKEQEIWKEWRCWKSLETASLLTINASVYLMTSPATGNMVRFHFHHLGDLVYINPATSKSVPKLPLGEFFRLIESPGSASTPTTRHITHLTRT